SSEPPGGRSTVSDSDFIFTESIWEGLTPLFFTSWEPVMLKFVSPSSWRGRASSTGPKGAPVTTALPEERTSILSRPQPARRRSSAIFLMEPGYHPTGVDPPGKVVPVARVAMQTQSRSRDEKRAGPGVSAVVAGGGRRRNHRRRVTAAGASR